MNHSQLEGSESEAYSDSIDIECNLHLLDSDGDDRSQDYFENFELSFESDPEYNSSQTLESEDGGKNHMDQQNERIDIMEMNEENKSAESSKTGISFPEKILWILSFTLKYNIPNTAVNELIKILAANEKEPELRSVLVFRKWISSHGTNPIVYLICPNEKSCSRFYMDTTIPERCSCGTGLDSKKLRQSGRYFLYIPMAALLRDLLEVAETEEEILRFMDQVKQTKDGNMHNVFDAIRYKKLLEVPPLYSASCHSVSMLTYKFNIDGVESCKSASNSLYPLQVMLNELPPKLANKLVLTPFLFIKSKENDMAFKQEYLKVFADDCNELSETGITYRSAKCGEEITIRVLPYCFNSDSPMKATVLGIKGCTGFYSCPECIQKGESVKTGKGTGTTRTRCLKRKRDGTPVEYKIRNEKDLKIGQYGQISLPSLVYLDHFDIFQDSTVDAMHGIYIGVFKSFYTFWFETSKKPYSITSKGKKYAESIMSSIIGIDPITRGPRKLSSHGEWKASEWKNFGFIYSPFILTELVAQNLMKEEYLTHWLLLLEATSLLNSHSISEQDLRDSKRLITLFLSEMPRLYSERNCTFNFHLLLHMPDKVRTIGPLWQTSLFANESYNTTILRSYRKGTKGILLQIAERLQWLSLVPKLYSELVKNPKIPEHSIAFDMAEAVFSLKEADHIQICGEVQQMKISLVPQLRLQGSGVIEAVVSSGPEYDPTVFTATRVKVKGQIFQTLQDFQKTRPKQRRSYFVVPKSVAPGLNFGEIRCILKLRCQEVLIVFSRLTISSRSAIHSKNLNYGGKFSRAETLEVISAKDVRHQAILMRYNSSHEMIFRLPNYIEGS